MSATDRDEGARPPAAARLRGFAIETYGREGVQAACLRLQDEAGLDVNLILFAAWLGAERRQALSEAQAWEAADQVRSWRAGGAPPLRSVRRALKAAAQAPEGPHAFRDKVKALELEAELIQLDMLERWSLRADFRAETAGELAPLPGANMLQMASATTSRSGDAAREAIAAIVQAARFGTAPA